MRRPLKGPFQPKPFCDSNEKTTVIWESTKILPQHHLQPPHPGPAQVLLLHTTPQWPPLWKVGRNFTPAFFHLFFLAPLHIHDPFLPAQTSLLLRRAQHPSGCHDTDSSFCPSRQKITSKNPSFAAPVLCFWRQDRENTHPLLLLLGADVAADVGPGNVLGPPDGFAALLAPARLPTTRGIFQHLGDEGSQLCLGQKKKKKG